MRTTTGLGFVWSDDVAEQSAAAFAEHARRIHARLPDLEIRYTGGSSVPGVLTIGDVDLQVRVVRESFAAAREALTEWYEPLNTEPWSAERRHTFVTPRSRGLTPTFRPRGTFALGGGSAGTNSVVIVA